MAIATAVIRPGTVSTSMMSDFSSSVEVHISFTKRKSQRLTFRQNCMTCSWSLAGSNFCGGRMQGDRVYNILSVWICVSGFTGGLSDTTLCD